MLAFGSGILLGISLLKMYWYFKNIEFDRLRIQAHKLLESAERETAEQKRILLEKVKDEIRRKRGELEVEIKKRRIEVEKVEINAQKRLEIAREKEAYLSIELKKLEEKSSELEGKRLDLGIKEERVENSFQDLIEQLEKISHMSRKEAREVLLNSLKNEVELSNQQYIAKTEEIARLRAKELATQILLTVMQRYTSDQVTVASSGVVVLPNEEIKGKIIGKEGRNIKSLEMATGMEFVIGDTSETITISGFNPVRREIARKALTALLADGRINPTRIEEVVARCEAEVDEMILEAGQEAILEFGFSGVHKEIIKMLGMLQFRTSYAQNVLEHSKEAAYFARMIAEELGLNGKLAARCGLFHDIGKAVSHEIDGPHAVIGAEFLRKHGEHPSVVGAVASHHDDVLPSSLYGIIVVIADTISASRTGARKETLAAYIKRIEQLEEIANAVKGVKKAYALQAGREIRVIVEEDALDDAECYLLARNLATRIEKEMNFPGQIKVHVIREKRYVEFAK